MARTPRQAKGYQFAAIGFSLAGLIWCVTALIGDDVGLYVPIGMMNICIVMFLAMSRREPPRQDEQQTTGQTSPD
jgi:hypothetical protein